MNLFNLASICLIAAMTVFIASGYGGNSSVSPTPVLAGAEGSPETPDNSKLYSANSSVYPLPGRTDSHSPVTVQLPTEQILRQYYTETLSVIPALMFSPAALQLAFPEIVNRPIDEHGNTLLHVASRSGDVFAAWQLLELGADPRLSNRFRKLPVHVVCLDNLQVFDALTTAFSSHQSAIAEVMSRRTASKDPVISEPISSRRTSKNSAPVGITVGVIAH